MKKVRPSKENLERLYVTEKKSTHEMAKILDVSQETARKWLIAEGIPLRSHSESLMIGTKIPSKEELTDWYSVQGKTAAMIASDVDVPTVTVYSWMKKYVIPRRSAHESVSNLGLPFGGSLSKMDIPSFEELNSAYTDNRKSTVQMKSQFGASASTIQRWLKIRGIPIRGYSESRKVNGVHLDEEWLRKKYVIQKASTISIADESGVSKKTILRALKEAGIPRRTTSEALRNNPKRSGENNPAWKGGLSSHTKIIRYSAEYLEACRLVRKRDKGCLLCISKGLDPKGKNHEVHHIETIASSPLLVFDVGNMILLCQDCHLNMRGKEEQWRKRLFNLIQKPE